MGVTKGSDPDVVAKIDRSPRECDSFAFGQPEKFLMVKKSKKEKLEQRVKKLEEEALRKASEEAEYRMESHTARLINGKGSYNASP